jgi:YbgC/YbaW family acyl-CoA thioester hydrolase
MARTRLDLPQPFNFKTEMPVRITDLNYGGHLGNDTVLSLLHEARVRFLNSMGYSEFDIEGAGIIMADAVIQYRLEAFYGDVLTIEVTAAGFEKVSCDFFYRITNSETGKEVVRAKTTIVFFDYENRKKIPVPEKFKEAARMPGHSSVSPFVKCR